MSGTKRSVTSLSEHSEYSLVHFHGSKRKASTAVVEMIQKVENIASMQREIWI